jgi:hypothetical protein
VVHGNNGKFFIKVFISSVAEYLCFLACYIHLGCIIIQTSADSPLVLICSTMDVEVNCCFCSNMVCYRYAVVYIICCWHLIMNLLVSLTWYVTTLQSVGRLALAICGYCRGLGGPFMWAFSHLTVWWRAHVQIQRSFLCNGVLLWPTSEILYIGICIAAQKPCSQR